MGSSVEPEEPKGIDASVGGLVWVRRRNGSWWPGRIMGLDELSEGCLVSPRSGTPVKLLGREDASVDWYNLEKSKRVKAFRCGEYDDCIEKAKASAANANKKTVKYARREDAIIHALEIENARLGKDCPDFSRTDNFSGEHGNSPVESPAISHSTHEEDNEDEEDMSDELSNSEDNLNSTIEMSQSGISFEEPSNAIASKMQSINERINERRRRTPNDSEDDGTEGIKRMRGLEDLGMGVAAQQDSASLCDSNNGSPVNGSKTYSSSLRRKRSQVSSNGHEYLKRKNRRRPLAKVLESTAMVSVPVTCDQLECNNSKRSIVAMAITNNSDSTVVSCENGVISDDFKQLPYVSNDHDKVKENEVFGISGLQQNDSSDVLFDVLVAGDDKHDAGFPPMMVSSSSEKPENGQAKPVSERNEAGSTSSADTHVNNLSQTIDKGTSKWQSKGKRNSRQLRKNKKPDSRKSLDMHDEPGEHFDGVSQVDGFPDWSRRGPTVEKKVQQPDSSRAPQRSLPHRQSRFTVNSRYPVSDFPAITSCPESQLYDVILEVKASYKPQHVPIVSLMSKLNGKAIIGHPLTVEAMEDGSSDILVNSIQSGKNLSKNPKLQSRYSPVKKKVGILSKKTRKLSSLTGSHKQPEERRATVEKLKGKGPVIACIPLKLVFSRINEAVTRPTHRSLMSSNL